MASIAGKTQLPAGWVDTARSQLNAALSVTSPDARIAAIKASPEFRDVTRQLLMALDDPEFVAALEQLSLSSSAGFPPDGLGKAFKAIGGGLLVLGAGLATVAAVVACPLTGGLTCPVAAITGGAAVMIGTALLFGSDIANETAQDADDARSFVYGQVFGPTTTAICNMVWEAMGFPPMGCAGGETPGLQPS